MSREAEKFRRITMKGLTMQLNSITIMDLVAYGGAALGMVLAIAFFVRLAMAYFDYRRHGQFEWTGPAILFVCLIFVLLAPNYIWGIVGL